MKSRVLLRKLIFLGYGQRDSILNSYSIPGNDFPSHKPSELVFVDLLRSPRIDSQPGGPVRQPYLSYRPDRLHRLAESNPGLNKRLQIRALVLRNDRYWLGVYMSSTEAESKEKHGVYKTLYAGVDYNLTLCPLQGRLQHLYHGQWALTIDDLLPMPESTLYHS
jgi:hypothetical protein